MAPRAARATSARKARGTKKARRKTKYLFEIVTETDHSDNEGAGPSMLVTSLKRPRRMAKRAENDSKKQKIATDGRELVHPSTWFARGVADDLWMPASTSLQAIQKPRQARHTRTKKSKRIAKRKRIKRRKRAKRKTQGTIVERARVPESQRLVEPLLTSWFDVTNFTDVISSTWRTPRVEDVVVERKEKARKEREEKEAEARKRKEARDAKNPPTKKLTPVKVKKVIKEPVNSILKLRLYPTRSQREKLEHMFASNRAVFNKLVAYSREDCAPTWDPDTEKSALASIPELVERYRPIAQSGTMFKYFRNNKNTLARHLQVQDEVRDSAFCDYKKAVKSSRALFFELKKKDKKTTFPELRFKSKFAPSNTIEIRPRSIKAVFKNEKDFVRFHPVFFGFAKDEGIEIREKLPDLTYSIRLQRLREGEYYIVIPRTAEFPQTQSSRVCAIDPGVRNFVTVYDPEGRTFSVKDAYAILKTKFDAVDDMKSKLALLNNASKANHPYKLRSKMKKGEKKEKTKLHRQRHRLRRTIRFTSRHVTRMVSDMHHKISSWLALNYNQVLLPSFQTSDMVRKYEQMVAAGATPATSSDEVVQPPTRGKKRKILSSTARGMLTQAHYKFKMLLKYKMARVGGRVVECEEEYTSKTCSKCGEIKENLGGSSVYKCSFCNVVLDRDVNAAKNIFHKNMELLC